MKCMRCGRCCRDCYVIIPLVRDGKVILAEKLGGEPCPNLELGEDGRAHCAVHHLPEYEGSPCWTYGNSYADPDFLLKRGKPCPVGSRLPLAVIAAQVREGLQRLQVQEPLEELKDVLEESGEC